MSKLTQITLCLISFVLPSTVAMQRSDSSGNIGHHDHLPRTLVMERHDTGNSADHRRRRNSFAGFPLGAPQANPDHPLNFQRNERQTHVHEQTGFWQKTKNFFTTITREPECPPITRSSDARTLLEAQNRHLEEFAIHAPTAETYAARTQPIIQECARIREHLTQLRERVEFGNPASPIRCALIECIRRIYVATATAENLVVGFEPQLVTQPVQSGLMTGFFRLFADDNPRPTNPALTSIQQRALEPIKEEFNHALELYKKIAIAAATTQAQSQTMATGYQTGIVREIVDPEVEANRLKTLDDGHLFEYLQQTLNDAHERSADMQEFGEIDNSSLTFKAGALRLCTKLFRGGLRLCAKTSQAAGFGADIAKTGGEFVANGGIQSLLRVGMHDACHVTQALEGSGPAKEWARQRLRADHDSSPFSKFEKWTGRFKWVDGHIERITGHNTAYWLDPETTVVPGNPAPGYSKLNFATLLRWGGTVTEKVAGWFGRSLDVCSKKLYVLVRKKEHFSSGSINAILHDLAQACRPNERPDIAAPAEAAANASGTGLLNLPVDDLYAPVIPENAELLTSAPAPHPDDSDSDDEGDDEDISAIVGAASAGIHVRDYVPAKRTISSVAPVEAGAEPANAVPPVNAVPANAVPVDAVPANAVPENTGQPATVQPITAQAVDNHAIQPDRLLEPQQPTTIAHQQAQHGDLHWFQKGLRVTSKFSGLLVLAVALLAIAYNS